ncbi:MAG: AEC family transporter [Clostridia bacterium]|nr:AEC family transporter [Clostridia bacterium]MBQ2191891.1 AEC family transporter [Clostridia bacterium]MBQ3938674.1 AEC family transporter [Clostridia bacterium]MBQ5487410.1 AEC family transporter [Clostridia bacterium]
MLETTFHSLIAVLIVMFMVGVGWLFGKLGYIKKEHKSLMIKLIICAGMPALVVNNVFGNLDLSSLDRPLLLFLLPALSMLITLGLGIVLAKILKPDARRRGGFITMCAFSNSIFVGLPMNTGLFGNAAVPYVMCFYIVNTTLFWTIGNYLISRSGEGESHQKGFFKNLRKLVSPPLVALAISLPLLALGVKMPEPVVRLAGYMGNIVTPIALFYIGYALYEYGLKSMKPDKHMLGVMLVRFICAPLVMAGLSLAFGFGGMPAGVLVIESAMPVMTQAVVVAAAHDADEGFVAGGMSVTTLGCFVLVPLLMLFLKALGII